MVVQLASLVSTRITWSDPDSYNTYTGWGYAADIIEDMKMFIVQ